MKKTLHIIPHFHWDREWYLPFDKHRIRALFTSDIDTSTVLSEGLFDLVHRDITPAPTWKNPCNSQRTQTFVTLESESGKDALMIANRGLCEYEVLRDGHNTPAVTLTLKLASSFTTACLTNPAEEKIDDLAICGGKLVLEVPAKKIVTVALS